MDDLQMIEKLSIISGEHDNSILETYLELAKEEILARRFPYGDRPDEFPSMYDGKALKIANFLIQKIGAEGQTEHSVDGVTRKYGNADVPDEMLNDIVPLAKAVRKP